MLLPGAETAKSHARLSCLTTATSPRRCCHKTAVSTARVPERLCGAVDMQGEKEINPCWLKLFRHWGCLLQQHNLVYSDTRASQVH